MDIEKVVAVYVKIRDKKSQITKEYEAAIAELDEKQNVLQSALLEFCKEANLDSVKTTAGTAFRTVRTKYWISDWQQAYDFILEHNAPELLEKRLAQKATAEWLKSFPGDPIPSLQTDSRYTITVRRGKE